MLYGIKNINNLIKLNYNLYKKSCLSVISNKMN